MYAILKGYKINVRKIIEKSILDYFSSKYRGLIPHPTTITRLCILGGIEGTWEEEERCTKTSPLTLINFTRPSLGKDKGKIKEMEEENKESRENEQAIAVSSIKEREERPRNLSPIWNPSLDDRDYNQELAEGSGQQGNNQEILEMLKRIEEGMKERENQLRNELKERDIFLDRELRKRDQYYDEVIRQRVLVWRGELERRETEWREVIRDRDVAF